MMKKKRFLFVVYNGYKQREKIPKKLLMNFITFKTYWAPSMVTWSSWTTSCSSTTMSSSQDMLAGSSSSGRSKRETGGCSITSWYCVVGDGYPASTDIIDSSWGSSLAGVDVRLFLSCTWVEDASVRSWSTTRILKESCAGVVVTVLTRGAALWEVFFLFGGGQWTGSEMRCLSWNTSELSTRS